MRKKEVNQLLIDGLYQLLKNKDIEDITISELIKVSGVGRSSFYRNYYNLTDIIIDDLETIFDDVYSNYPMDSTNVKESVQYIFEVLLKHKEKMSLLEKRKLTYLLDDVIYKISYKQILALNVLNNNYQPYFFSGASAFLIRAWIQRDFQESPKMLADIFMQSLKGYMEIKEEL